MKGEVSVYYSCVCAFSVIYMSMDIMWGELSNHIKHL